VPEDAIDPEGGRGCHQEPRLPLWGTAKARHNKGFLVDIQATVVANTAVVPTNEGNAATPEISVFANQSVHMIINVMGYFIR
jgi:hypothetical protein